MSAKKCTYPFRQASTPSSWGYPQSPSAYAFEGVRPAVGVHMRLEGEPLVVPALVAGVLLVGRNRTLNARVKGSESRTRNSPSNALS